MLLVLGLALLKLLFANPVYAQIQEESQSATVSATVLQTDIVAPVLLTPTDNSVIQSHTGTFSFVRASSSSGINHYDFILDGTTVFNNLYDSYESQDTPLFTSYRNNQIIYFDLKFNLAEGLHNWRIDAHSGGGATATSELFEFTIDSTLPFIILDRVEQNDLDWQSHHPETIPDLPDRFLTSDTPDPDLRGYVEPGANIKLVFMCPDVAPTECVHQTVTYNSPTGLWQHQFTDLISGVTYEVYLIATDAANNITNFPVFYVTYGSPLITPTPSTISPSPTTLPSLTLTPTASVIPIITLPPGTSIPLPPTLSEDLLTPPPPPTALPIKPKPTPLPPARDYLPLLRIIFVFGLVLHLLMTIYGSRVYWKDIPKFLFNLLAPFLRKNTHQTIYYSYNQYHEQVLHKLPFTVTYIYDPDDLSAPLHRLYSDVLGELSYHFVKQDPEAIFIISNRADYESTEKIISPLTLDSVSQLVLSHKDRLSHSERLQVRCLQWRLVPLLVAVGTGVYAFILIPNLFYFAYATISLTFFYSEYLYPRLSK